MYAGYYWDRDIPLIMMVFQMSFDEVLNLTIQQFNSLLRMANLKVTCDSPENYKLMLSKLPSDAVRAQNKDKTFANQLKADFDKFNEKRKK